MEYSLKNRVELVPCGAHEPSIATKGAGEGAGAGPEQVGVMYCNVTWLPESATMPAAEACAHYVLLADVGHPRAVGVAV